MRASNIAELRPLIGLALRMGFGPWIATCIDGISNEVHIRAGSIVFIFKVDDANIKYLEPGQEVHVNIATGKLTRVLHESPRL